jgi:hypothetical protein
MVSLHKWHREVPDDLRFDPAKLSISRESVSTFLHYYQCINMTARPLLFHVVHRRLKDTHGGATTEQDWKLGLSQTTIRVIEMCISAAQDTINMMAIAAQLDLVATYGYMDGEHAFSATIVLVMVCGAFSTNVDTIKAMNAGLDLLRDMSQRGNSHMGARYELLAHLKSILMPGAGPSGTVVSPGPATMPAFSNATSSKAQVQPIINTLNKPGQNQGLMMLGHIPNVGGADFGIGSTFGFAPGTEFTGSHAFADMCYDVDASFGINVGSDDDSMLWEEGFADPAGYDLTQWTQVTQMAVDGGNAAHFIWDNADGS